jgi:predicted dehydrogenase
MENHEKGRRTFIKQSTALGLGALTSSAGIFSISQLQACAPEPDKKLGVALVGLGNYSTSKLAPAFQETQHCYLAGIVTGTPEKAEKWQQDYGIAPENVYNYENFDKIKDNPDIDIVYVVLPNSMHAEYTIRAAQAGKHVICEKPMAVSVQESEAMIAACKTAGKKLQIGYRVQYDPYTQELMRVGQKKVLGQVTIIQTGNAFNGLSWDNWRFNDKSLSGGGALMDMGVYCIQGARYTLGEEPVAVTAQGFNTHPDHFIDVEETLFWQMEFPSGAIANCTTSYAGSGDYLKVSAEKGNFGLSPAYGYSAPQGHVNNEAMDFPHQNQQAVQMDAFAQNINDNTDVIASGEEGLRDMKVIEAIYQAMQSGQRVEIA